MGQPTHAKDDMAAETFSDRYFVAAPLEQVYAHLVDPQNYVGLSPLVVDVRDVTFDQDEQGHTVQRYVSVERFHFLGFIRYDNLIRVTTTLTNPPAQIVSEVDSPAWVRVRFTFDLEANAKASAEGTWVSETINANAPGLFLGFVVREARRVQQERARILRSRLEP